MNVIGYVRVSTDAQVEHGHGLAVQEQALRAWAKAQGHKLVEIFREEGVSGTKDLLDRPALADALEALRRRQAQGVVVYRLDRLARDLVLQEQLLAEVKRLGARVFTTMAGEAAYLEDDPDDPSRRLIRQILGAVSEYERSVIVMRLRSGRRRKHQLGGYAYGAPPLGLRAEGKALVTDVEEQRTLARIAELRKAGKSLREVGAVLEAEGHRPKRGGKWHPETLRQAAARAARPSTASKVTSASKRATTSRPATVPS
jgi:DNA invertase Pin-like site-specific DNA recombinase